MTLPDPRWFYIRERKKIGPVAFSALQQTAATGVIGHADMVLREGTAKWVEAGNVEGLFPSAETTTERPPIVAPQADQGTLAATIDVSAPPQVETVDEVKGLDGSAPQTRSKPPDKYPEVAGHEILGVLGRGGMGVVYKARQVKLNRLVALKMILGGEHAGPEQFDRFLVEARAVARLQHPHIVQIHEIGEWRGGDMSTPLPYFSLEFVDGGSLDRKLGGVPQPPRQAAEMVGILSRAMHAAHQQGIVHRDLKPANVLLAADGTPKITDFGLAKQLDDNSGQTRSGAIMGTPSYMAPEQAAGRIRDIGPASDVYALGAILYEMLTGRPPFRGETPMDTVIQVVGDEPVPPSRLVPKLSLDLETICLKCLQKESRKRYETAESLSDDLRRYLNAEPIIARPIGRRERLWRWCRRKPALASLSAALIVVVATAFITVSLQWRQSLANYHRAQANFDEAETQRELAVANAEDANQQRTRAEERELQARRYLYASWMNAVASDWDKGNPNSALKRLQAFIPEEGQPDVRGFEWHHYWKLVNSGRLTVRGHNGPVFAVSFSPDGQTLATCSLDMSVKLWNASDGTEVATVTSTAGRTNDLAISPDGKTVGFLRSGGTSLDLWNRDTKKAVPLPGGERHYFSAFDFAPDGRTLAAARLDKIVELWDWTNAKHLGNLEHSGIVGCVAFSPDSKLVAAGTEETQGTIHLWDVATRTQRAAVATSKSVWSLAFAPNGKTLAAGFWNGMIRIYDVAPGGVALTERAVYQGHRGNTGVLGLAFSPQGTLLASGSVTHHRGMTVPTAQPGEVKLWDVTTGKEYAELSGHAGGVFCVKFSADGKSLATASADGTAKIWDVPTPQSRSERTPTRRAGILALATSADGTLASAGEDCQVRLWQAGMAKELAVLSGHADRIQSLAFAHDGKLLASGGKDRTVKLWDCKARALLADIPERASVRAVAWSADDSLLAFGSDEGTVTLWDRVSRRQRMVVQAHHAPVHGVAFAPDGKTLVSGSADNTVAFVEITGGAVRRVKAHGRHARALAFSPDTRRIVAAEGDRKYNLMLWDTAAGGTPARKHLDDVIANCVLFSPDGKHLAVGGTFARSGMVQLFEVLPDGLKDRTSFRVDQEDVSCLAFSSDGRSLIAGGENGTLTSWDLVEQRVHMRPGHAVALLALDFSPDGKTLATGGADFCVRLIDPDTERVQAMWPAHEQAITAVAFSPDGQALATASFDRTVKVWDVRTRRLRWTLAGHQTEVRAVKFAADGLSLASGGGQVDRAGEIILWNLETGQETARFEGVPTEVRALAFVQGGAALAAGAGSSWGAFGGPAGLWDLTSRRVLTRLDEHQSPVSSLALHGDTLATGGWDHVIKLWDLNQRSASGRSRLTLLGHTGDVLALAYAPGGRTLASASADETIKLWDGDTGQELATLRGHASSIHALAFAPDASVLASAGDDGVVRFWRSDRRGDRERGERQHDPNRSLDLPAETAFLGAQAHSRLAVVLQQHGRGAEASQALAAAQVRWGQLAQERPGRPEAGLEHARSLAQFAEMRSARAPEEAAASYRRALDVLERSSVGSSDAASYQCRLERIKDCEALAGLENTPATERETLRRRSVAEAEALLREFPGTKEVGMLLAGQLRELAFNYSAGREKEQLLRRSMTLYREVATADPEDQPARLGWCRAAFALTYLLTEPARQEEKHALYRDLYEEAQRLVALAPDDHTRRNLLANTANNLGVYLESGPEGERLYREALEVVEGLIARSPQWQPYRITRAFAMSNLAGELARRNAATEAEALYRRVIPQWRELAGAEPKAFKVLDECLADFGALLRRNGRAADAEQLDREALGSWKKLVETFPDDAKARVGLARSHCRLRDHAGAAKVAEDLARVGAARSGDLVKAVCILAGCAKQAGADDKLPESKRAELARVHADRAMELLRQAVRLGYRDAAFLKNEPELEPLRSRNDFEALLKDLSKVDTR